MSAEVKHERAGYRTISARGLDWESVPMRLFQKAKRLGTWDPQAIDMSRDRADWIGFDAVEKDFILRTVSLFQATENPPFGQRMETFLEFASVQFDKRMKVLERDHGKSLAEISMAALADLAIEEAGVGAGC